jgi:hypothetical protein
MIGELFMATSPKGRVSFPNVFEAVKYKEDDKPKFSVVLVIDHKNLDAQQKALLVEMKNAANKVAQETFGCDLGGYATEGGVVKSPFRKTEEKPKYYDPGKIFIRFANKYKPNVVDRGRQPINPQTDDFYAGCWAHVSWEAYAYDYMGNKGISFSLGNIQKTGEGEPLAGKRTAVEDDFEVMGDQAPSAAVTSVPASVDDDIPF